MSLYQPLEMEREELASNRHFQLVERVLCCPSHSSQREHHDPGRKGRVRKKGEIEGPMREGVEGGVGKVALAVEELDKMHK